MPPQQSMPPRAMAPGPQAMPSRAPRPQPRAETSMARKRQSWLRPWMVIAVILVLAGVVAILVAMSGPDVPAVPNK
jgi:hypothetical protein